MAKTTKDDSLLLEERKVKALEKIANTIDALTIWFEEIEKNEWSDRLQWYLSEWYNTQIKKEEDKKQMKLGVIVPYRKRPTHLRKFQESIKEYLKDYDYELIIV